VKAGSTDDIRRQAIVVLSDGEDTSSVVSFEEVLDLAKRSETAIYCIGLRSKETTSIRGFKEPDFVLRQLAQETGGRAFFINEVAELGAIYAQISDELSNQYTVGYTSNNPKFDGAWRRVVVRVNRPNVTTRTKMGYYAPKPKS
jgi:Ca-activated chloride channel homolog